MKTVTIEHIHEDVKELKRDIAFIKHLFEENLELSEDVKKRLQKARQSSKSSYAEL